MFNLFRSTPKPIAPPPPALPTLGHPKSWWDESREQVKGCQFLNSYLVFGYDNVCCCCILPPGAKGAPPSYVDKIVANKYGPAELVDLILKARDEMFDKLQAGDHPACSYCSFFKSYPTSELRKQPYAFSNLTMTYIEGCTLKCFYCYQAEPSFVRNKPKQRYEMPAILREMFARDVLDPHGFTFWAGGEPTIGDDFDETVELLSQKGGSQCLNTNALRLSNNVVDILKRDRRFSLVCSVDAGTAANYAKIKGFDVYPRVMKNLGVYAQTGGNVTAKYIILEENYAELLDFGRQAVDLGLREFTIDFDNRSKGGAHSYLSKELLDASEQFIAYIRGAGLGIGWAGHSRGTLAADEVARVERMFVA